MVEVVSIGIQIYLYVILISGRRHVGLRGSGSRWKHTKFYIETSIVDRLENSN